MEQSWKKGYTRYKGFFLNILTIYNSKPNLKIYLELILSLGTIVMFSIFAIRPTILTIIEINNEIRAKEEIKIKLERKIRDLKTASSLLQNQAESLTLIDQAVPNNINLERLVPQIESLASQNSVAITGISSSEILVKGTLQKNKKVNELEGLPENSGELPISIVVSGEYGNLVNFTKSVESLRRPMKVDSFIFSSTKSVENSKVLTLTLVGRFPYLLDTMEKIENEK